MATRRALMIHAGHIFEFGPFVLDVAERRLLRSGTPLTLRAKVFDTLRVLVEKHGHLVDKETLMATVWPDTVVEEGNVAHTVAALRKVLGSRDAPSDHIETIPGRGYRFVTRVTVRDSGEPGPPRQTPAVSSWDQQLEAARAALASAPISQTPAAPRQRNVVGRQREVRELVASVESARSGRGVLIGLTGEAGIGKSTVLELFLASRSEWGADCLVAPGRCSELLATSDAYFPLLDALDGLLRSDCGSHCAAIMKLAAPTWFLQVQPLWAAADPSFASIAADARTASRERMKRELVAFIEHVSRARPLVLVVDDLHWADASTIEFIDYLSDKLDALRAVVLVAYRATEIVRTQHPFLATRQTLQRRDCFREVSLELLGRDDVSDYVGLELPQAELDASLVDLIHGRTEGNPLFVTDLVKHLRDRGIVSERDGRWHLTRSVAAIGREVPVSARTMIERRLEHLTGQERAVLVAGSVHGDHFESRIVADICEMEPADVEERLRALERLYGFVRVGQERQLPDSSVSVTCAFAHVLYQHAIVDGLPPTRRADLSKRAAAALLTRHGTAASSVASQLAYLFEIALDFERAADFFLLAAANAAALFANEEAVGLSRRAIACAERLDGGARQSRVFRATVEMAQLQMVLSRFDDAAANFRAAEEAAAKAGDVDGQIRAVCGRAGALFTLQRLDEMAGEGARAVSLAQGSASTIARATADTVVAMARMNAGDLAAAEHCFSRAIPVLRQEGLWVQSLDAISFRGLLHHMRLEFEQVEQTSGWAIDQARKLGATFYLIENMFCWGMALANRGRLGEAMTVLREGIRLADLNGERSFNARLSNTLAWLCREVSDFDSSRRLGDDAVRRAREMRVRDAEVHAHINLAGDYLELLDPGRAGAHLQEAERLVAVDHIFQWRQMIRYEEVSAAFWLASGDVDKAAAHAISALDQAKQTLSRKHMAWSRKLLGDVAMVQDRHAEAVRCYEAALKVLESHPCPLIEWKILAALAAALSSPRHAARAGTLRDQALTVKHRLAESLDDRLRPAFLSRPAASLVS